MTNDKPLEIIIVYIFESFLMKYKNFFFRAMKQPESELYVDTSRDEDLLIKNDPKFESGELRGMTKDHWRVCSLHFSFFS